MHNCQSLHYLLQHTSSKLCHLYSFSNHSLLCKISSFGQNSRLYRNFLYLYNCQPLHHLLQRTSFLNSVIFTLLATTHYFTKYPHFGKKKIVVFTSISCTCITANLSITSFNSPVSATFSLPPSLPPLLTTSQSS